MNIHIVGSESLGVRGLSCYVELKNRTLFIDPGIALSQQDLVLAEAAALLHDIGRFEQYRRYRTFVDRKSEDHAALGVKMH